MSHEVGFLHEDKHKSLIQIDTMILICMVKHSQSSQNSNVFKISKNKLEMKLIFSMQINIKVSYKLISTILAFKFPTRWCYHYRWVLSSSLKVLKVTSLQYLYNISKKKLGMEFIFCMHINFKVSTSWHYQFWWKWADMLKVHKVILLWCKTLRCFMGV